MRRHLTTVMAGGGLLQLIGCGAQDARLYGINLLPITHVYNRDTCFVNRYEKYNGLNCSREYNNFNVTLFVAYPHGNASFTTKKYSKMINKYNNTSFLDIDLDKEFAYDEVKGSDKMNKILKEQLEMSINLQYINEYNRKRNFEMETQAILDGRLKGWQIKRTG